MKRTCIRRTLRHALEWCGVFVLAIRVAFRRLRILVWDRPRVPA